MKRIISAYLEQTQKFETEANYQTYLKGLDRKRIKYKIVDKHMQSDNTVTVKLIRDYNNYPANELLD